MSSQGKGSSTEPPRDLRVFRFTGTDGRQYAVLRFKHRRPLANALTDAEHEVAMMVLAGFSNEDIARTRRVTKTTVATQVRSVFARFGVSSRAELVARLADR
jgi:DNA-binding CsgD family transcriptional regulator